MGVFDFWRKKEKPKGLVYAPTNNGAPPFYTSFGESVYASDIVVQSIRCKANEFKKLDPRHIRTTNGVQSVVNDSSIARVLKRPNAHMTTADFLEKITILLELTKNVFIYPMWYKTKGGAIALPRGLEEEAGMYRPTGGDPSRAGFIRFGKTSGNFPLFFDSTWNYPDTAVGFANFHSAYVDPGADDAGFWFAHGKNGSMCFVDGSAATMNASDLRSLGFTKAFSNHFVNQPL